MSSVPDHDLDWLAFRYLACELSDEEATALAERLADEQPLREAIARMAELTQTVALAAEASLLSTPRAPGAQRTMAVEVARSAKSAWIRPAVWVAIGAAACLALVLAYNAWRPNAVRDVVSDGGNGSVADQQSGDVRLDELAAYWLAGRDGLVLDDPLEFDSAEDEAAPSESLAMGEGEYDDWIDEQGDPVAPSWLLLAVRESSSDEMETEPIMPEAVPEIQEN